MTPPCGIIRKLGNRRDGSYLRTQVTISSILTETRDTPLFAGAIPRYGQAGDKQSLSPLLCDEVSVLFTTSFLIHFGLCVRFGSIDAEAPSMAAPPSIVGR